MAEEALRYNPRAPFYTYHGAPAKYIMDRQGKGPENGTQDYGYGSILIARLALGHSHRQYAYCYRPPAS
jgi:hypothetical protein